jgi:hypothetical protein
MTLSKRCVIYVMAGIIGLGALELGERLSGERLPIPGIRLISSASAVVGRPLTPVSVAGVARRTSRRTTRRVSMQSLGQDGFGGFRASMGHSEADRSWDDPCYIGNPLLSGGTPVETAPMPYSGLTIHVPGYFHTHPGVDCWESPPQGWVVPLSWRRIDSSPAGSRNEEALSPNNLLLIEQWSDMSRAAATPSAHANSEVQHGLN